MLPEDDCWAMIMQCLKDEPAALCRCSEDLQGAPARRACAAAVTSGQGRRNNAFPLWKLSYFEAEWDSIRTNITIEEVTSHLWRFRFLHYPSPSFVVRYNPDFTYDSCMFATSLPWRLVGASSLQVDAFPALHASRSVADWGWCLQNMHVRMDQIDAPCSLYAEACLEMMELGHFNTYESLTEDSDEETFQTWWEEEREEEEEEEEDLLEWRCCRDR
eukprot:Tamp_20336.p1 GENE.Tamp_20336~~Tamp_20336.p1  ORF type:complete len:217 (-),score=41.03 Tamp_20336:105-755(-)